MLRELLCCREDRSYIITGGLGGFGLALAVWLSNQGAKNLVMTSKRGMRTGGQRKVIEMLRSRGVNVSARSLTFLAPCTARNAAAECWVGSCLGEQCCSRLSAAHSVCSTTLKECGG